MDIKGIESLWREGAYITHYDRYGKAALTNLEKLEKKHKDVQAVEDALHSRGEDEIVIHHLTSNDREELELISISVEMFCCMSIEAFLNFYGSARLGEDFYKRNFERLGITEKLEALLATCTGVLLPKGAEITRLLRKMFDKRNSLVHPKSKELTDMDHSQLVQYFKQLPDILVKAQQMVSDMKQFFELLMMYDNQIEPIVVMMFRPNEV